MSWFFELATSSSSISHTVFILCVSSACGLMLGSVRILGVRLGLAGVLFAGIFFGHFKLGFDQDVLEFIREFGLILFVYMVGLQIGPGFFASFRESGVKLNLLALLIVGLGVSITLLLHYVAGIEAAVVVGLLSGGTTNTPSLGAAQAALAGVQHLSENARQMPGIAYAIAYPFGILGILLVMGILRRVLRVDAAQEAERYRVAAAEGVEELEVLNLSVKNPNLDGAKISDIPAVKELGVVISRVMSGRTVQIADSNTEIHLGDVIYAVGPESKLAQLQVIVGEVAEVNILSIPSDLVHRRLVITHREVVGKRLGDLNLRKLYGASVTRIFRGEVEFLVTPNIRLQLGDRVRVVGSESAVGMVEKILGNSVHALNHPEFLTMFLGLIAGVCLGSIPFSLPGVPVPVKLGLAGGPLVVALILGHFGHLRLGPLGTLSTYLPHSANLALRELGIVLFLACVGLKAGDKFLFYLFEGDGFSWILYAACITFIPLLIAGIIASFCLRLNYLVVYGLLAGSMTDPPALAFANSLAVSNAPSVSYATVYPMVMLLRVVSAQILVLVLLA